MPKKNAVITEPIDFKTFALQDLKKLERLKNVLSILFQDFYLFISRCSIPDNPEWKEIETTIDQILEEYVQSGDVTKVAEGTINRNKDHAIRTMVIFEIMRQYNAYLKQQTK